MVIKQGENRREMSYIETMKHVLSVTIASLCLAAAPAVAQDNAPSTAPSEEPSEGWQMLREGSRLLMEQFFQDMEPALEELEGFVDDLSLYEAPVILPNGDILIRRKPEEPRAAPNPMPEDGDSIDL